MRSILLLLLLTAPVWAQTPPTFIEVTAQPANAFIVVDREIQGSGHVQVGVAPGPHLVRVSAGEDWQTWTRQVDVPGGTTLRLEVKLEPGSRRLIQRARALMAQGQFAQAVVALDRASHLPRQVEPFWWLGVAQWKAGNYNEAVAALREYAQYITDWPDLYLFLGLCQQSAGRPGEAFTCYKKALLLSPSLTIALDGLGEPTEQAIAAFKRPSEPVPQLRLAQLLMLKGRMGEADNWARAAADQIYPGWSSRDWSQVEPRVPAPPPEPSAPPLEPKN